MENTWNFRILAKKVKNSVYFGVYEVHYEGDIPVACTENSVKVDAYDEGFEDPIETIQWQLENIRKATEKPVLNYDDFPNEYVKYSRRKKLSNIKKLNEE